MTFKFPKKNTFDTPEGDYRAIVREAFEMQDGCLRITFQLQSLESLLLTYFAGKTYKPGKQVFAEDLIDWLGLDALQDIVRADGTIDIAKLKGLPADIRITHIQNDDHAKPYAYVSKIVPPRTLTPHFQSAA